MTAYLNSVQLIGNITSEPNHFDKNGNEVATASIAVNQKYKSNDEVVEDTQFFNLVFFGERTKLASLLQKGKQVFIEGALRIDDYEDNDGTKRKSTSIVVRNVQLLGKKESH